MCHVPPKRGQSGLPQSTPAPRLRQPRAPSPGRGVPVPCHSGERDRSLPPAGSGPIGRGTCARPGLGAPVVDALPRKGQLSKLSHPPQPFRQLLIGDLARQVRGGRPTQTAPARQQVMHAAARQLHCGTSPCGWREPELPNLADAEEQRYARWVAQGSCDWTGPTSSERSALAGGPFRLHPRTL